jgi:hypothetical protein
MRLFRIPRLRSMKYFCPHVSLLFVIQPLDVGANFDMMISMLIKNLVAAIVLKDLIVSRSILLRSYSPFLYQKNGERSPKPINLRSLPFRIRT